MNKHASHPHPAVFNILTYDNIPQEGLDWLSREKYALATECLHPQAILLRSTNLHGSSIPESVLAVGRAGSGVNNIPVEEYSKRGIPVFNAPGANANAVKELTLSAVLRKLGAAGAFAQHHQGKGDVDHADLGLAVKAMSVVAQECLSTAFCVWCQDAFGWYLQNTENRALCARLQDGAATGVVLGGTGLSNPMKALSGIESIRLRGRRVAGGYKVDGVLPWVSNIEDGHYFGVCFSTDEESKQMAAALARIGAEGVSARHATRFIALEGTCDEGRHVHKRIYSRRRPSRGSSILICATHSAGIHPATGGHGYWNHVRAAFR